MIPLLAHLQPSHPPHHYFDWKWNRQAFSAEEGTQQQIMPSPTSPYSPPASVPLTPFSLLTPSQSHGATGAHLSWFISNKLSFLWMCLLMLHLHESYVIHVMCWVRGLASYQIIGAVQVYVYMPHYTKSKGQSNKGGRAGAPLWLLPILCYIDE